MIERLRSGISDTDIAHKDVSEDAVGGGAFAENKFLHQLSAGVDVILTFITEKRFDFSNKTETDFLVRNSKQAGTVVANRFGSSEVPGAVQETQQMLR